MSVLIIDVIQEEEYLYVYIYYIDFPAISSVGFAFVLDRLGEFLPDHISNM